MKTLIMLSLLLSACGGQIVDQPDVSQPEPIDAAFTLPSIQETSSDLSSQSLDQSSEVSQSSTASAVCITNYIPATCTPNGQQGLYFVCAPLTAPDFHQVVQGFLSSQAGVGNRCISFPSSQLNLTTDWCCYYNIKLTPINVP